VRQAGICPTITGKWTQVLVIRWRMGGWQKGFGETEFTEDQ